jgi:ergothioneine biosynthesis protein EgtB
MSNVERESLALRYRTVRAHTEALAEPLSPEDQQVQSMPSCSPTKWHRAHTTWFFETFVLLPRGASAFHPAYGHLFNSYYEAIGPRHARPKRGLVTRPTAAEVGEYRRVVDERMLELLARANDDELSALAPLIALGTAHEEQHQELLLTDILHAFSENPVRPVYRENAFVPRRSAGELAYADFEGGLVSIGVDESADAGFSFDNEGPCHRVHLEPFAIATRLVNVGELRAFVREGGYRTPSLWLSEGYDFVRAEEIALPPYLREDGPDLYAYGLDGERRLDDDEPVLGLSYFEADALARFLGGRLPTEAEWEHAMREWPREPSRGARPRDAYDRSSGIAGTAWEWTSSAYAAYPRYRPVAGALGEYNGKFMSSQMVLRGGSDFTPRHHTRLTYRNFWPASTRFQRTGLRLARDR